MTVVHQRGWAKVKTAARYADVSPRTLRKWFEDGLPYVKAPTGVLLVKLELLDEFLAGFEQSINDHQIDQIVDEVLKGERRKKGKNDYEQT